MELLEVCNWIADIPRCEQHRRLLLTRRYQCRCQPRRPGHRACASWQQPRPRQALQRSAQRRRNTLKMNIISNISLEVLVLGLGRPIWIGKASVLHKRLQRQLKVPSYKCLLCCMEA